MNETNDPLPSDDLDRLLQSWAAGREAGADHLSALQRQIVSRLGEKPTLDVAPESKSTGHGDVGPSGPWFKNRTVWLLATIAASLLLIVTARLWMSGDGSKKVAPGGGTIGIVGQAVPGTHPEAGLGTGPETALRIAPELPAGGQSLSKEQLLAKAQLFAEMQAIFGRQLEWLAETTGRVELGLADGQLGSGGMTPGSTASGGTASGAAAAGDAVSRGHGPLLVHVVVERRATGAAEWKTVWETEVVALNQEPVVLPAVEGAAAGALSLWAYRLPDGMVFVESELTLSGLHSSIRSTSTNILENNRATEVGSVDADGAEYRIFQTAAALDGNLG